MSEPPLRAAEAPSSWGVLRNSMEHASELFYWGEEAACLLLDSSPSLGSLLEALIYGTLVCSGKGPSELPLPERTLRQRTREAVGVYGNCLQVPSKVAHGGVGGSGTSATGLYTCYFMSCLQ